MKTSQFSYNRVAPLVLVWFITTFFFVFYTYLDDFVFMVAASVTPANDIPFPRWPNKLILIISTLPCWTASVPTLAFYTFLPKAALIHSLLTAKTFSLPLSNFGKPVNVLMLALLAMTLTLLIGTGHTLITVGEEAHLLAVTLLLVYPIALTYLTLQGTAAPRILKGNVEVWFLVFCFVFLAAMLISTTSFLGFYVLLEGLTLTTVAILLLTGHTYSHLESTLKYFCLSTFSSVFVALGIGILYFSTGHLDFFLVSSMLALSQAEDPLLLIGLTFFFTGLSFKFTLSPAHFWAPDVYTGLSFSLIFLLSVVSKLPLFLTFFTLLYCVFLPIFFKIKVIIYYIGLMSTVVGCFGALSSTTIKRFIAYSSTNQIGLVFVAASMGTITVPSLVCVSSLLYLATLTLFLLPLLQRDSKFIYLSDLSGLFQASPILALYLSGSLLSFAGIPPFVGFFSKFLLTYSVYAYGYKITSVLLLVINLISSFYYLRVLKIIFFSSTTRSFAGLQRKSTLLITSLLLALVLSPYPFMAILAKALTGSYATLAFPVSNSTIWFLLTTYAS